MYSQADLSKIIRRIPWFSELNQAQVEHLADLATIQELPSGKILFKEGDHEDYLFVLLGGQIALEIEVPSRGQIPIYTAEVWDVIGWSSMTPVARQSTALAKAVQPSMVLGLNSKLLQQACEEDHDLGYVIMRRLSNIIASRLLTTRLCLFDLIANTVHEEPAVPHEPAVSHETAVSH